MRCIMGEELLGGVLVLAVMVFGLVVLGDVIATVWQALTGLWRKLTGRKETP